MYSSVNNKLLDQTRNGRETIYFLNASEDKHMPHKRLLIWILIGIFILPIAAQSATYKKGTTSGGFLKLEVGPRAAAMGGAYVGLANDATATFWNPSGLTTGGGFQLFFQNSQLYAGMRQTFLASALPVVSGWSLGFFVNHLNIGNFEETTLNEPDGTGEHFSARNVALGISLATQLTDHVSVGVTGKFIEERIWYEISRNFAFDLGTLYRFSHIGVRVGMLLSNLGPGAAMNDGLQLTFRKEKPPDFPGSPGVEAQLKTGNFPLPMMFTLGVCVELVGSHSAFAKSNDNQVLFVASSNDAIDAPFRSNLGLEYAWRNIVYFRAGYRFNYDTSRGSLGFGLNFLPLVGKNVHFDYAWVDYGDLNSVSMWSFSMGF